MSFVVKKNFCELSATARHGVVKNKSLCSLKDLVQGIFVKPTIVGMKRNLDFTLYLVRERSRYNENVKKVLGICENLEESRRTSLLK